MQPEKKLFKGHCDPLSNIYTLRFTLGLSSLSCVCVCVCVCVCEREREREREWTHKDEQYSAQRLVEKSPLLQCCMGLLGLSNVPLYFKTYGTLKTHLFEKQALTSSSIDDPVGLPSTASTFKFFSANEQGQQVICRQFASCLCQL